MKPAVISTFSLFKDLEKRLPPLSLLRKTFITQKNLS